MCKKKISKKEFRQMEEQIWISRICVCISQCCITLILFLSIATKPFILHART
jgi:hypothetical protein